MIMQNMFTLNKHQERMHTHTIFLFNQINKQYKYKKMNVSEANNCSFVSDLPKDPNPTVRGVEVCIY